MISGRLGRVLTFGSIGIFFLVLIIGLLLSRKDPALHGSQIKPASSAFDFRLTDQNGNVYQLSDHQGKIIVLVFGYTHCPDICPMTLAQFRDIQESLRDFSKQVEFVLITVDPELDSVERMKEYVDAFSPQFFGLTGTQTELEPVWKNYGVFREIHSNDSSSARTVDHSTRIYVIDRQGKLILTYPFGFETEKIVQDLRYLLSSENG